MCVNVCHIHCMCGFVHTCMCIKYIMYGYITYYMYIYIYIYIYMCVCIYMSKYIYGLVWS